MQRELPETLQTHSVRQASEWLHGWAYGVDWTPDELRGALAVLAELRRVAGLKSNARGAM